MLKIYNGISIPKIEPFTYSIQFDWSTIFNKIMMLFFNCSIDYPVYILNNNIRVEDILQIRYILIIIISKSSIFLVQILITLKKFEEFITIIIIIKKDRQSKGKRD